MLPPKRDKDPAMTITTTTDEKLVVARLYAVAETAADRAEMHSIIGEQRNNWNHLLLHSINSIITLTAGISSIPALIQSSPHLHLAFRLSSVFLFAAPTAVMMGHTHTIRGSITR